MKRNMLCTLIGGVVLAAGFATSAGAQTCASPASWQPSPAGDPPLTGSTCGNEGGIISVCQSAGGAPAAAFVARVNVAQAGTFEHITFTGGAGYTVSAYLVPEAGGCNADAACTTVGDGSTPMAHADIAPGSYYLILTGADFDAPGSCGTFTATADGSLPVTLKSFSVG